jgi:glycosyltransferase involved in cell wall biosynthesis
MYHDPKGLPRVFWIASDRIAYNARDLFMTQKPCRIAFVIDDLSYGGAQRLIALLAASLPAPYVPKVFCLSHLTDPYVRIMNQLGIDVLTFRRRSHFDPLRFIALVRALSRSRIDIVHGILDASNAYAFLAGHILRKPVVLSLLSERLRVGGMKAGILLRMYRRCDKIWTNSQSGERYLLRTAGVAAEKIALVRNMFPMDELPKQSDGERAAVEGDDDERIGYVGRFSRLKNVDVLIRAFKAIASERPRARLVLIGHGEERDSFDGLIEDLQLGDRVEIRERVPDVLLEMQKFKCLVLPSANEGLPNVIVEALAVGIPVVANDAGDVSELLADGRTGVLIAQPTVELLTAAMSRVLSDPEISRHVREEGPRLVRENFSTEVIINKFVTLYDSVRR